MTAAVCAVTFAAVPLILASIALLASYLPARRVTRVDPVVAPREEQGYGNEPAFPFSSFVRASSAVSIFA